MANKRTWADGSPIPDELFENMPLDRTKREVGNMSKKKFDRIFDNAGVPRSPRDIKSEEKKELERRADPKWVRDSEAALAAVTEGDPAFETETWKEKAGGPVFGEPDGYRNLP